MSHKKLQVTTQQNNNLQLDVSRTVYQGYIRKGLLRQPTGRKLTVVIVQYGLGIVGEGPSLKAAIDDFHTNWNYFCTSRKSA